MSRGRTPAAPRFPLVRVRARVRDGRVEAFGSEGSGRISGLSWAEGLVELDSAARHIRPGDLVRYLPFGSFGM